MQEIHPLKERQLYEVFPVFGICFGKPMDKSDIQDGLARQLKKEMGTRAP